mmetsp:Transcript_21984/g.54181  ORF Transcript_21984/g.54181 Transcript_21984/m.54181 type:complete len:224 (-) Transcript_21984:1298-1969(-)
MTVPGLWSVPALDWAAEVAEVRRHALVPPQLRLIGAHAPLVDTIRARAVHAGANEPARSRPGELLPEGLLTLQPLVKDLANAASLLDRLDLIDSHLLMPRCRPPSPQRPPPVIGRTQEADDRNARVKQEQAPNTIDRESLRARILRRCPGTVLAVLVRLGLDLVLVGELKEAVIVHLGHVQRQDVVKQVVTPLLSQVCLHYPASRVGLLGLPNHYRLAVLVVL